MKAHHLSPNGHHHHRHLFDVSQRVAAMDREASRNLRRHTMTKQKTVIDQLLTMLEFRADSQALDRVKQRLEDFDLRLQAAARRGHVPSSGVRVRHRVAVV